MLTRMIRDCRDGMACWSVLGLFYALTNIYLNNPNYHRVLAGILLLWALATFWNFYRRLRYEQEWLKRFDQKGKEKG